MVASRQHMRVLAAAVLLAAACHAHVLPRPRVLVARPRAVISGRAAAAPMPGGGVNLYRQFGITEDASYDEILAAYALMCTKAVGNKKELIKLEVAKDRILEDRLRQRVSGKMSGAVEGNWDRKERMRKLKPFSAANLPRFMQPYVLFPKKDKIFNVGVIYGLFAALGFALPPYITTLLTMGLGISTYMVYYNGIPSAKGDTGERRPAKLMPFGISIAINILCGGIGWGLGSGLGRVLSLNAELAGGVINLGTLFGFGFAALYGKAQEALI
mmetsp:Transcript_21574/g.54762  ORF Transcript_21574/g.54762 Transcript_21574/m.54762 type:complete len:271 (-) Transcript_21574:163-975(-)